MDPDALSATAAAFAAYDVVFWAQCLVLCLLLVGSALVSGAEVALFGLSAADVGRMEAEDGEPGRRVAELLKRPRKLLATILIANNAVNIAVVLLFSDIAASLFGSGDRGIWRILFDILVATVLILIFGEIVPKIYANRNREGFSRFMSVPLTILDRVLSPFSLPMQAMTSLLQKRLGKKGGHFSVDHLSQALELTSEGDTTVEEKKILEGIVSFGNTDTKQVMRPRIDIFALSKELPFEQVLEEITRNGYSRIPVYDEHMDKVIGVLYVKDLLPYIERKSFNWVDLLREPYFVPENKKLDDLLLEFQEQKKHLAIVVDEYGGTSGIVTLEDIIEEIVGDISDEFDDDDLVYSKLDDHNYVFEGKTTLKDFYRVVKISDEEGFEERKGESETIAGFVLEIAKGFPKRGEKVQFGSYQFVVESLDRKRLKQIKVTLPHEV